MRAGKIGEVGCGGGEGATINVPLPGDSGQAAALAAWEEVVAPAARRFAPDIILVSAGYDAHWRDPLAGALTLRRLLVLLPPAAAAAARPLRSSPVPPPHPTHPPPGTSPPTRPRDGCRPAAAQRHLPCAVLPPG